MALSPDENERGYRPCICLARIPWTDSDRILTCFVHIVVPFLAARQHVAHTHPALQECGKRFWSTIKAAVDLNRPLRLSPPPLRTSDLLDSLPPIVLKEPYLKQEVLEKVCNAQNVLVV